MKKIGNILFCFFLLSAFASADIFFSGLDLNAGNGLLFTASVTVPGGASYDTLFLAQLDKNTVRPLTCFPEKMESLNGGRTILVQNRFGSARYSRDDGSLVWTEPLSGFAGGGRLPSGKLGAVSASPDGKWLAAFRKTGRVSADLVLFDAVSGAECVIASGTEFDPDEVPVLWAPDSRTMLYSYAGSLYFASPSSFFSQSKIDDRYRRIGAGSVNSAAWVSSSHLMYINSNEVYTISVPELLTRSLYSDLIGTGTLRGKLPFVFDSNKDFFAAGKNGDAVTVVRNNRIAVYVELDGDDFSMHEPLPSFPYMPLPGSTLSVRIVWPENAQPVIWVTSLENGQRRSSVYRLENTGRIPVFTALSLPEGARDMEASPGKTRIAFSAPAGVYVYDTVSWKQTGLFSAERVFSYIWTGTDTLCLGGIQTVSLWNPDSGGVSVLFLSGAPQYGWNEQGTAVVVQTYAGRFSCSAGGNVWTSSPGTFIRGPAAVNSLWRVYTDVSEKGYYGNAIYARSSAPLGRTFAVLAEPDPFSGAAGKPRVALTFDALDNADGLSTILDVLSEYGVTATFFINGEFIRRHPSAVREIAEAGQQCASMFFSSDDLTNPSFKVDEEFVLRGLARNEDDFFAATGRELSLLWHTPYYVLNPVIAEAGKKAGYTYVGNGMAPPDWVTFEMGLSAPGLYKSASEITDSILGNLSPGAVIPVSVGKPQGVRSDYLYEKIDMLVNGIIEAGYEIVPVTDL